MRRPPHPAQPRWLASLSLRDGPGGRAKGRAPTAAIMVGGEEVRMPDAADYRVGQVLRQIIKCNRAAGRSGTERESVCPATSAGCTQPCLVEPTAGSR